MSLVDILTYDPILQRTYLKIDCLLFWPFRGIVDLFFWLYIATFCLPWVPGAPPGGSLGGVPGPMSAGQFSKHAHGCLGAWEGGPVVPGPPPLGPWGAFRGIPYVCSPLRGRHPSVFASKFMLIWMSIFGRIGVDPGSLLDVIFAPFGDLARLSWSQSRLRTVLTSNK